MNPSYAPSALADRPHPIKRYLLWSTGAHGALLALALGSSYFLPSHFDQSTTGWKVPGSARHFSPGRSG